MTRRKRLTKNQVIALPIKPKRYFKADPELSGHYIRVMPTGAKSYACVARDPYGKQIWHTVGAADLLDIEDARDLARDAIKRIKAGKPAVEPTPVKLDSYESVAQNWIKRHVEAKKLRSQKEIERILSKYVFPHWGKRDFVAIKRGDIAGLLDMIEDEHGAGQANATLAIIRGIANWYAKRHESYVTPFVKGMKRGEGKARDRILTDDELRTVWKQAGSDGVFGAFVKTLLLTAQRRTDVLSMRWSDIDGDKWTMPREDRAKGNAGILKLPPLALAIIKAQPKLEGNPHIFALRADGPIRGVGKAKNRFAERCKLAEHWTLHDLRRSSRSLLSRAGVRPDIAERVLGHAIEGVEGIYDRHPYTDEKAHALAALAKLIEDIINGTPHKVVPIRRNAKAG